MPCKSDSGIWMRHNNNIYEYIGVYVDDILCIVKDPRSFLNHIIKVHKYKLKGDEPLSIHLVCDFSCNPDMLLQVKKYMSKMFKQMFPGETLKKQSSPILKGAYPELDESEFVSEEDKVTYISMISTAQWLVTL